MRLKAPFKQTQKPSLKTNQQVITAQMINISALRNTSVDSACAPKRDVTPLARELAAATREGFSRGSQPTEK